jgi:hypothetical protein
MFAITHNENAHETVRSTGHEAGRWTMRASFRFSSITFLLPSLLLSGCFIVSTSRKLPVPKAPPIVQTVAPEELVERLNRRWATLDTFNAKVEIQASTLKAGLARDYTTIGGIILMRKPESLRVLGRAPIVGLQIFDMVSDGNNFILYIPALKKAFEGSNSSNKKSDNQLENLRPGFFLDAMVIRGLAPEDEYMVTAETVTVEDPTKKHLNSVPEYILSIMRRKPGSRQLTPVRVVIFHRDDLLPYQQDLYDDEDNLETQVFYTQYSDYGTSKYPTMVTIKRPIEECQIVLTVENVVENNKLIKDDQFQIDIPKETVIQHLN